MDVFAKIEAQRKGREGTAAWMVGQQLIDILRDEPASRELVDKDLDVAEMSLEHAAGKIKAFADKQPRKGNCVCVPPDTAERIIREFYGLSARGQAPRISRCGEEEKQDREETPGIIDLADFL